VAVDSKQFFHNTFDRLIQHESWNKMKPVASSEANRAAIREIVTLIIRPEDAKTIASLDQLKGVVKHWISMHSPELDQSDQDRFNKLKNCFKRAHVNFNPDGLNRLTDDGPQGIKAQISQCIDRTLSVEMNYERLKQYCLQIPLKIDVVKRLFIRKLFDLYPEPSHKEAVSLCCLQAQSVDVYALQELLCDQFKHLKIEDEAARLRLAKVLLAVRPDLFSRHYPSFQIREESNRLQLALSTLYANVQLFINHYDRFMIQSDKCKLQMALELALFDPQLAEEYGQMIHLTNVVHQEHFTKFILCVKMCALVFEPNANPQSHAYQNALLQWIHMDFSSECVFPQSLVDQWRQGLVQLFQQRLDVQEAQQIVRWAVERAFISTEHFAQFQNINPENRVHLAMALYQQDPEWGASNLFVIARN
jgi:hypothetical protein